MRHDQNRPLRQSDVAHGGPFGRLHAEAVHAGVKLDAEGMIGQAFEVAQKLFERVDHRNEAKIGNRIGVARHMAREHIDRHIGAERIADRGAFFGEGDEKFARTGAGKGARDAGRPEAIAVGLDHSRGFDAALRGRVKRTPVGHQRIQIDFQTRSRHGGGF